VNILFSFFNRGSKLPIKFSSSLLFETSYLFILIAIICISQTARFTIPIVSARQLVYLENLENSHLDNLQKRFQESRIIYEEGSWYDSQIWEKPFLLIKNDKLIETQKIEPIIQEIFRKFLTITYINIFVLLIFFFFK
jgi:hypothetical protein